MHVCTDNWTKRSGYCSKRLEFDIKRDWKFLFGADLVRRVCILLLFETYWCLQLALVGSKALSGRLSCRTCEDVVETIHTQLRKVGLRFYLFFHFWNYLLGHRDWETYISTLILSCKRRWEMVKSILISMSSQKHWQKLRSPILMQKTNLMCRWYFQ